MKKIMINFTGKTSDAILAELQALDPKAVIDIQDGKNLREDVLVSDEIQDMLDDQVKNHNAGNKNKASAEEIAKMKVPAQTVIECLVTSVTRMITRKREDGTENSFKVVSFITADGTKDSIPVNATFLGLNEGEIDGLLQNGSTLELTLETAVAGETQYIEKRKGHVNEGKILTHTQPGRSIRNVKPLNEKQAEVLMAQFEVASRKILAQASAAEKEALATVQVKQAEAFGTSLEKYAGNPQMFEKMAKFYEIAMDK